MKRTGLLFAVVAIVSLAFSQECGAITILKQVEVAPEGDKIELAFDQPISRGQIQIEYVRDIVQLNLKDVSIYPAKILSVTGKDVKKIFAYQYTPNLVRFRMTVAGDSADYANRVHLVPQGKNLTVTLSSRLSARNPQREPQRDEDKIIVQSAQAIKKDPAKEAELLKAVLGDQKPALDIKNTAPGQRIFTGGTNLPPLRKVFGWMLMLLGSFVFIIFTIRKFKTKGSGRQASKMEGLGSFLGKFLKTPLGAGSLWGKNKLIEVVSTHYLGPKKSIAVVKVKGRMLLVGITNESINLISELSPDSGGNVNADDMVEAAILGSGNGNGPGMGATSAGKATFSSVLNNTPEPEIGVDKKIDEAFASNATNSVREQIRRRVEGMKAF